MEVLSIFYPIIGKLVHGPEKEFSSNSLIEDFLRLPILDTIPSVVFERFDTINFRRFAHC